MTKIFDIINESVFRGSKGLMRDFNEIDYLKLSAARPHRFTEAARARLAENLLTEMKYNLRPMRDDYQIWVCENNKANLLHKQIDEVRAKPLWRFCLLPLGGADNFMAYMQDFYIAVLVEKIMPAAGERKLPLKKQAEEGSTAAKSQELAPIFQSKNLEMLYISLPAKGEVFNFDKNRGAMMLSKEDSFNASKKMKLTKRFDKEYITLSSCDYRLAGFLQQKNIEKNIQSTSLPQQICYNHISYGNNMANALQMLRGRADLYAGDSLFALNNAAENLAEKAKNHLSEKEIEHLMIGFMMKTMNAVKFQAEIDHVPGLFPSENVHSQAASPKKIKVDIFAHHKLMADFIGLSL